MASSSSEQQYLKYKIFASIRRELETDVEYKRLILMVAGEMTISQLKRDIEKEFADLFPLEEPFICAKLEDEFGYALSNSSKINELLKGGDRIIALPVDKRFAGRDAISNAASVDENFEMVMSMVRTITIKLANTNLANFDPIVQLMEFYIPMGFLDKKDFMLPVSSIIKSFSRSEDFSVFGDPSKPSILRNLVALFSFWVGHPLMLDSQFATNVVDSILLFIKSSKFSRALKKAKLTHLLINISKSNRVAAQVKSKILKIIKYLSLAEFGDRYTPKETRIHNRQDDRAVLATHSRQEGQQGDDFKAKRILKKPMNSLEDYNRDSFVYSNNLSKNKPPSRRGNSKIIEDQKYVFEDQPYIAGARLKNQEASYYERNSGYQNSGNDFDHSHQPPRVHSRRAHKVEDKPNQEQYGMDIWTDSKISDYGNTDQNSDQLYLEYLSLLDNSNTQELISYGVQNLAPIIDDSIYSIMTNKSSYLKLLNLIELNLPYEEKILQKKILNSLARNVTEDRAQDGINALVIERILKFFNRQGADFQPVFTALILSHIKRSNYQIKVNGLIEMLKSQYINLQDLSLKVLKEISEPNLEQSRDFSIQFEAHIRYLLVAVMRKDRALGQLNSLLEILSNLSINDYLCPEIIHHRGIVTLLYHLREQANVDGQRLAAKALLNIGCKSRENKLRIIPELSYEIKSLHRGELDNVVRGYISALLQSSQSSKTD